MEQVDLQVTISTFIREVLGSNMGWKTGYSDLETYRGFPQPSRLMHTQPPLSFTSFIHNQTLWSLGTDGFIELFTRKRRLWLFLYSIIKPEPITVTTRSTLRPDGALRTLCSLYQQKNISFYWHCVWPHRALRTLCSLYEQKNITFH
jgi:hypothetical protein